MARNKFYFTYLLTYLHTSCGLKKTVAKQKVLQTIVSRSWKVNREIG